jgi:hypothetical protein
MCGAGAGASASGGGGAGAIKGICCILCQKRCSQYYFRMQEKVDISLLLFGLAHQSINYLRPHPSNNQFVTRLMLYLWRCHGC